MLKNKKIIRLRQILRRMVIPTYTAAKLVSLISLHLEAAVFRREDPYLVYSMGKVGTSTVVHSLKKQLSSSPVYHFHTLCDDRLKNEEKVYASKYSKLGEIHAHLLSSIYIRKLMLSQGHYKKKWKIVTLVREPIQRNISAFFQTLHLHGLELGFSERIKNGGDKNLIHDMMDYFTTRLDLNRPLTWFDSELKKFFDIDIIETGFPQEKGYGIYHEKNADALVIRLEDLNCCAAEAFQVFAGVKDFKLENRQVSPKKYYADTYRQFVREANFPEELVDRIYDSKFAKTFYSPSEINGFREKWCGTKTRDLRKTINSPD